MTLARIDFLFDIGSYAEAFAAIDQFAAENPDHSLFNPPVA